MQSIAGLTDTDILLELVRRLVEENQILKAEVMALYYQETSSEPNQPQ